MEFRNKKMNKISFKKNAADINIGSLINENFMYSLNRFLRISIESAAKLRRNKRRRGERVR